MMAWHTAGLKIAPVAAEMIQVQVHLVLEAVVVVLPNGCCPRPKMANLLLHWDLVQTGEQCMTKGCNSWMY
jgi:hypothetical protein